MQVTNTIEKTRELVNNWKKEGKTIGLVPTMGFRQSDTVWTE